MLGRLLSRPAKLRAKEDVVSEDIVSMAHAFALAMSERDGVTPEQQLAAREHEQKLLAQERARNQELEQQLSIRQNDQKLVTQERARTQALEQQLAGRPDEQKLLAQERVRNQELKQQLSIRQHDQKLVRGIILMAHDLGYRVVAEGIENHEAYDMLASWNCDEAQGYLIAHPLAPAMMDKWLEPAGTG